MINLLRDELLDAPLLLGDETELQVLKEPGRCADQELCLGADDRWLGQGRHRAADPAVQLLPQPIDSPIIGMGRAYATMLDSAYTAWPIRPPAPGSTTLEPGAKSGDRGRGSTAG